MVSDVQAESRADRADGIVAIDATRGLALDEKQTVRVQIRTDLVRDCIQVGSDSRRSPLGPGDHRSHVSLTYMARRG